MIVYLIRHGMTMGNQMKRYIGTTDEPLCPEGIEQLRRKKEHYMFVPDELYVSPMLRCIETADFLFPEITKKIISDFRECDFGEFENKNYLELAENTKYQEWIDSNGQLPFPGGEDRREFQKRSIQAFRELENKWKNSKQNDQTAVIVAHGGTIMSILEEVGIPKKSYYDFQVGNGEGYRLEGTDGSYGYQKLSDHEPV